MADQIQETMAFLEAKEFKLARDLRDTPLGHRKELERELILITRAKNTIQDLRRDAERYHWLFRRGVDDAIFVCRVNQQELGEDQFELLNGNEMEEAIDRAMSPRGPTRE